MTFDPNIPQAPDDMSVSQGQMLDNFTDLNNVYGNNGDHVPFDAATNKGKHNKVTFVTQGAAPVDGNNLTPAEELYIPNTESNDLAMFALEDGTDTEIYLRKENNGAVNKITQQGELFIQVHPVFAINMDNSLTVFSSFNYDAGTGVTRLSGGSAAHFKFPFTNQVLDAAGAPTNNYMFTASGFDSSSNPVVGQVPNDANYNNQVDSTFINIIFKNQANNTITSLTRCSIVCWRIQ